MMKNEREKMIKVGTKVIGHWGAGLSLSYGEVTEIMYEDAVPTYRIVFDDGEAGSLWTLNEITFGSYYDFVNAPIGVYAEDVSLTPLD
jgi:hypothetical protein